MSKPEDVPQDAWDFAATFMERAYPHGAKEFAARAIMAAKTEEREACARVADEIAAGRSRQKMQAATAKKRAEARDFESMAMSAIDVSYAIRKRGESK